MLILSRRANQKISFPEIGITVHFIRVKSGNIKIGVDAPIDIQIVRGEIDEDAAAAAETARKELLRLPREVRHEIRGELHMINLGIHLYKEQIQLGQEGEAKETFRAIMKALGSIDSNSFLNRPHASVAERENVIRKSILVVEHHMNEREILASCLRHQGCLVSTAADCDEAIDLMELEAIPDVILLDLRIPQCDPEAAVREFRNNPQLDNTKIYGVSDISPEDFGISQGRSGVDQWIPKPLDISVLINTLACETHTNPPSQNATIERPVGES